MTPAEEYRKLAADLHSRVSNEETARRVLKNVARMAALKAECEQLALYILLAEQSNRNNTTQPSDSSECGYRRDMVKCTMRAAFTTSDSQAEVGHERNDGNGRRGPKARGDATSG